MQLLLYSICIGMIFCACNQQTQNKSPSAKADSLPTQYAGCVPEVMDKTWYASGKKAPLFSGLDGIHFPVSTKNSAAQKYFDQGMMLSFAFNHAEAGRSFYEAAKQDSTCAMCWWGFAYVLGPNYNAGMEKDNFQRAYDACKMQNHIPQPAHQKKKI